MLRILVPVDGPEAALRAVRQAVALGGDVLSMTEIVLLNVQPHAPWSNFLFAGGPSDLESFLQAQRAAGEKVLHEAKTIVEGAGIACRGFVEIGDTPYVINNYVGKYHCDQIVMGTRGLGGVYGMRLGAIANKVLHLAHVPVTLVK